MTPEEAQANLLQNVYLPVFLEKCAERGITFKSEEELAAALEAAARLKTAEQADDSSVVKAATADLRAAAGESDYDPQRDARMEQALDEVGKDPGIREALATLNAGA